MTLTVGTKLGAYAILATLYGMEIADERRFLRMELIEGETLEPVAHPMMRVSSATSRVNAGS